MIAAIGVANNAPIRPKAAPIDNNKKRSETGWIFMVLDLSLGIRKSAVSSFNTRKNTRHQKAVAGLMESATKVGGMAIM